MGRNSTIARWRSFLCIAVTGLCSAANVQAQTGLSLGRLPLPKLPPSASERSIRSWTVDPLMTPEQEETILQELKKPCPFVWKPETTLQTVCDDLNEIMPARIDTRSLDDLGLTPDIATAFPPVFDPAVSKTRNPLSKNEKQEIDWLGENKKVDSPFTFDPRRTAQHGNAPLVVQQPVRSKPTVQAWWKQTSSSRDAPRNGISLAAYLIQGLEDLDLFLEVRAGTLTITTSDGVENRPIPRIYDVTTLLPEAASGRGLTQQVYCPYPIDEQSLMDSIQINISPDTWEALGGPSTMGFVHVRGRKMLVVTTMTYQHWAIMRYLEILNTASRGRY